MGIVLTGMGADGAKGLMAIHAAGGEAFAQDAASCVVDGMPQRARETGVVDYIGTPVQIARHLLAASWAHRRNTA
jgi:two-component system chemotaxis response regulator CheB